MKVLKFRPELADLILKGEKTTTWRLFDDKDLRVGDVIEIKVRNDAGEVLPGTVGRAVITEVTEKPIKDLDDHDWEGHEPFPSEEVMYAHYRKYYPGRDVGPETLVKILHFVPIKAWDADFPEVIKEVGRGNAAGLGASMTENDPSAASAWHRPIVRSLVWDIVLNTTIPVACYYVAKWFITPSELGALIAATIFPVLKSIYDPLKKKGFDPVAIVVLLGIVVSIVALFLGGDPRLLLIRESFFTGAFGIACLASLFFPRPIMFYFARYFIAGGDPGKREKFDAGWQNPAVRRTHRLISAVWGFVFAGEFVIRVIMVYWLPVPMVLVISPIILNGATILTVIWTFWYGRRVRERLDAVDAERRSL